MPRTRIPDDLHVAGLFAGIGGLERGLSRAGIDATLLCEVWDPARAVLADRFPSVSLVGDVRDLDSLPDGTNVLTAGFPCTDLSQAGRMAGITGEASGLVTHVFRLVRQHEPKWLVLENVRNMLALDGGRAMEFLVDELESLGYSWAYRLVDSRFTGVPQRRQRVLLVASKTDDPREVLLSQDAGEPRPERFRHDAFGFYWTEGLRGLGWAIDAVPTLKGGSTIGIPSPPGVWIPDAELGRRLLVPTVGDGEVMQGFPRNWTRAAETQGKKSARWKLVGNAVTVGVAEWLGRRLLEPLPYDDAESVRLEPGTRWPTAAWGIDGSRWKSHASMWPERRRARHLLDVLSVAEAPALSLRGASGFLDRTQRSTLRFSEDFILDVKRHVEHLRGS